MIREKRVLVVDDDDAIRSLVATVLRRRGLMADMARNGVEALERLGTCRYLILLLDLMMPAMNGWEVLDHLEPLPPRQRPIVIVLTAGSEPRAFKPDLVAGMVRKPFDIDLLVDTVVGCIAALEAVEQEAAGLEPDSEIHLPNRPPDELN
jgi:CheY-like chemotaxis protein